MTPLRPLEKIDKTITIQTSNGENSVDIDVCILYAYHKHEHECEIYDIKIYDKDKNSNGRHELRSAGELLRLIDIEFWEGIEHEICESIA